MPSYVRDGQLVEMSPEEAAELHADWRRAERQELAATVRRSGAARRRREITRQAATDPAAALEQLLATYGDRPL
jgi:hypothetical protein